MKLSTSTWISFSQRVDASIWLTKQNNIIIEYIAMLYTKL